MLAGLAVAALAFPSGASAASTLKILSPKSGKEVKGKVLVVKVRARGNDFSAALDGRNVAKRFNKGKGGVRTARLRRGRDFTAGRGKLLVAVDKRYSRSRQVKSVRVFVLIRRATLLRAKARVHRSALHVRLRSNRQAGRIRVWLNGRRIEHRLPLRPNRRGAGGRLGADEGLRHGRNRLLVSFVHGSGAYDRESRTIRVSRRAPIAGARAPSRIPAGRKVILDGTRSRAPRTGGKLRYRWTLIKKPRASKARILKPTARKPRLVTDRGGIYRARLTVRSGGSASARASASGPVAVDDAVVNASVAQDPMGVTIQTITDDGGIEINGAPLEPAPGLMRMVWLHPDTGTVTRVESYNDSASVLRDIPKPGSYPPSTIVLSGQGRSTGGKVDPAKLGQAIRALGGTVATQGTTPNGAADLASGQWSVIGVSGRQESSADQNFGLRHAPVDGGDAGQPGSLNGYMQAITNNGLQFISSESAKIDTSAPGSSRSGNLITVGSKGYRTPPVPDGSLAAHLLVLDPSDGLTKVDEQTYVLNEPGGASNPSNNPQEGAQGLANRLSYWNSRRSGRNLDAPLVILQTFGSPSPNAAPRDSAFWVNDALPPTIGTHDWYGQTFPSKDLNGALRSWSVGHPTVAGEVARLAGREFHDVVANFSRGTRRGGMAVVAGTHLYDPGTAWAQGQGDPYAATERVIATIVRNRQSQWQVQETSQADRVLSPKVPPDRQVFEVGKVWDIAFRERQGWPLTEDGNKDAKAYRAASTFVARELGWPDLDDVRDAYWSKESALDNGGAASKRADLKGIGFETGQGFSADQLKTFLSQVDRELSLVSEVFDGVVAWQGLLGNLSTPDVVNVHKIANDIVDEVDQGNSTVHKETVGINWFTIGANVLFIASGASNIAGPDLVGPYAGSAFSGAASAVLIGGALSDKFNPTPEQKRPFDSQRVFDSMNIVEGKIVDRLTSTKNTLDHLRDLYVTDWGKLQEAGGRFNDQWAFGTAEKNAFTQAMSVSAKQSFYTALMPIAYTQWVVSPRSTDDNVRGPVDPITNYRCLYVSQDAGGQWNRTSGSRTDNPFRDGPAGAVHSVNYAPRRADGSAGPFLAPITGRAIKSAVGGDRLQLHDWDETDTRTKIGVAHRGNPPHTSMITPLFQAVNDQDPVPSDPISLGMNKDIFYGQYWPMRKMSCGLPNGQ